MDTSKTSSQLPANRSMSPGVFIPELEYPDVAAAAKWLCQAFGFAERLRIGHHRAQLVFGGGSMVVAGASTIGGKAIMVRVQSVNERFERARVHGAKVVQPPVTFRMGSDNARSKTLPDTIGRFRSRSLMLTQKNGVELLGQAFEDSRSAWGVFGSNRSEPNEEIRLG